MAGLAPADSPAVLEFERVTLRRGQRLILDAVTWRIGEGEHWALLGANGSGKTTLLKVAAGYEWATSGRVRVLGRLLGACDVRTLRKHIGWVSAALDAIIPPQLPAHAVVLSGIDATLGVYRDYTHNDKRKADEVMDLLGITRLTAQPFALLSQGEQQRTLIARALAANPDLLILDEPCAGLDPAARERFLAWLGRLRAKQAPKATLLVTHHIEELDPAVSHVCVLKDGAVLASGPKREVVTGPVLEAAFGWPCDVSANGGRYSLTLGPDAAPRG